jgi:hypothetical protein
VPPAAEEWQVEVVVGTRWKGQRRPVAMSPNNPRGLIGIWQPSGWPGGYEVLAIISDGTTARSRIQVQAWHTVAAAVWTLPIEYWYEEGWFNPATNCDERMIPWT